MPIDYWESSADTGENNEASIEPIANGEPVENAYLNRAVENVRNRTEVLRKAVADMEKVSQSDRGLTIMSDPDTEIAFLDNGTDEFYFTTSAPLYLIPIVGTAEVGVGTPVYARYYFDDTSTEFQVECAHTIYAYGTAGGNVGSNNLYFRMFVGTGSSGPVVTLEPAGAVAADLENGPVTIAVELDAAGNTAATIIAAIKSVASVFVDATETKVVAGGTVTSAVTRTRFALGDAGSMGGVDNEGIWLTSTHISNFFDVGGTPNTMDNGDSLVLDFTDAKTRLSARVGWSVASSLRIMSSSTVNASNNQVVPICKVFDGRLCFINGAVFEEDQVGHLTPDVSSRNNLPFVVVDATNTGADYNSIQDAIQAIASTGGIVYVKKGTYAENISITASILGSIHVIGESRQQTVLNPAASPGTIFTFSTTTIADMLSFENLRFQQTSDNVVIDIVPTTSSLYGQVVIKDCDILRTTTVTGNKAMIESGKIPFEITGNVILDDSYDDDTVGISHSQATINEKHSGIRIQRNRLENMGTCVNVGTTAEMEHFVFSDNKVFNCGESVADTPAYLIKAPVTTGWILEAFIERNFVDYTGSPAAANSACFANVPAMFNFLKIADNEMTRGGAVAPTTNKQYMITLNESSLTGVPIIHRNKMKCGYGGAVVGLYMDVQDNTFYNIMMQDVTDQHVLYGTATSAGDFSSKVCNNAIICDTGMDGSMTIMLFKHEILFSGNKVNSISDNSISGIILRDTADYSKITNNKFYFPSGCTGCDAIYTEASKGVIAGNNTQGDVDRGIYLAATAVENTITGNDLTGRSSSASANIRGIQLGADSNTVVGNRIYDFYYGLYIDASDNCISGNHIKSYTTAINVASGTNNGVKNEADAAYVLTNNWY